ncbi:hypothetical protein GQ42DRAFT_154496 [Ramicandelaber brevisporus]|nr:hypothetical protein GQ42DRAFT_154496 [Ramicandelaber brevisporus]
MEIDMKQFLEVPADVKVALFGGVRITQTTTTTTDITTAVGGLRQTSAQTALQRHSDDGGGSADALRLHSAHIEWFDQWLSRCQPNTMLDIGEFEKQLSAMLLNVPSTALESILVQNDAAIASVQPFEASTVVPAILSICSASAIASDAATVFAHRIVYPSLVALSEPPSRALVDAVSEFARNKPRAALNGLLVPITDECCGKASNQALDLMSSYLT